MILCAMLILSDGKYTYLVTTDAEHFSRTHSKVEKMSVYSFTNLVT